MAARSISVALLLALSFLPSPPDLTAPAVQRKLDADLAKAIQEGEPGTATGAWKWTLSEKEKRNVLLHIRSLAR